MINDSSIAIAVERWDRTAELSEKYVYGLCLLHFQLLRSFFISIIKYHLLNCIAKCIKILGS